MANQISSAPTIFRAFDDGYTVRSMLPSDAATVKKWIGCIGLVYSDTDLATLLDLHPAGSHGFYVGEYEGQAVASLVQIQWGENVLYVVAFYVEKEFRGRGFGSRLLNVVAREHAGDRIVVLDSVEGWVAEAYQSWGYKKAFKTVSVQGVAKTMYCVDDFHGKIQTSKEVAFDEILSYDNNCFVSRDFPTRREFLRRLIEAPGCSTFVALTECGSVAGFGCRRPLHQKGYHIVGPLYAEDRTIAEAILARLCSEVAGDNVFMDICVPNSAAVAMAKKFLFEDVLSMHRMHRNGDPAEFKAEVFAMTTVELCGF